MYGPRALKEILWRFWEIFEFTFLIIVLFGLTRVNMFVVVMNMSLLVSRLYRKSSQEVV